MSKVSSESNHCESIWLSLEVALKLPVCDMSARGAWVLRGESERSRDKVQSGSDLNENIYLSG